MRTLRHPFITRSLLAAAFLMTAVAVPAVEPAVEPAVAAPAQGPYTFAMSGTPTVGPSQRVEYSVTLGNPTDMPARFEVRTKIPAEIGNLKVVSCRAAGPCETAVILGSNPPQLLVSFDTAPKSSGTVVIEGLSVPNLAPGSVVKANATAFHYSNWRGDATVEAGPPPPRGNPVPPKPSGGPGTGDGSIPADPTGSAVFSALVVGLVALGTGTVWAWRRRRG